MSPGIRPILSALRRNPTGAILVTVQVVITLAVLINAAGIVAQRVARIERPVGIDTRNTFSIDIGMLSRKFHVRSAESADLAYLRSLPGVAAATVSVGIPLTGYGSRNDRVWRNPGERGTSMTTNVLETDSRFLATLGIRLVAGRNFRSNEVLSFSSHEQGKSPAEVIVTEAFAHAFFPRSTAIGKTIYDGDSNPLVIIGVTRNFVGDVHENSRHAYDTILLPTTPGTNGIYTLVVRAKPGRRDVVMREVIRHIGAVHPDAVINDATTLARAKRQFEAKDRTMAMFLTVVTTVMLAVCCLGIFGLTTFNVGSRTKQIGTRRALGARKRDIVAHFMVENALILSAGMLLGVVLALAIGDWLTVRYALPRVNLTYVLCGVLVLSVAGQLAAWQPARRAAAVSPCEATRTV